MQGHNNRWILLFTFKSTDVHVKTDTGLFAYSDTIGTRESVTVSKCHSTQLSLKGGDLNLAPKLSL